MNSAALKNPNFPCHISTHIVKATLAQVFLPQLTQCPHEQSYGAIKYKASSMKGHSRQSKRMPTQPLSNSTLHILKARFFGYVLRMSMIIFPTEIYLLVQDF